MEMIMAFDDNTSRCMHNKMASFGPQKCVTYIAGKTGRESACNELAGFTRDRCIAYARADPDYCDIEVYLEGDKVYRRGYGTVTSSPRKSEAMYRDSCLIELVEHTGKASLCQDIIRPISRDTCINTASKLAPDASHCQRSSKPDECILLTSLLQYSNYCGQINDADLRGDCKALFE